MYSENSRQSGFTLIELMIVIVLVAIMMAVAVPSFTSFMSRYRLTTVTNDFLSGITLTRIEAIKRGRRVDMIPVSGDDWRTGWIIFIDVNGNQLRESTETLITQHPAIPGTVALSVPSGSVCATSSAPASPFNNGTRSFISYLGTGYPDNSTIPNGITLTENTNSKTLCVNFIGRPNTL